MGAPIFPRFCNRPAATRLVEGWQVQMPRTGLMASGRWDGMLRYIRGLAPPATGDDPTDRVVLRRFATDHDEAAFAELVRRHGPMVLSVCRRVLRELAEV